MLSPDPAEVPIFLLCGGMGTRLGDSAALRPKPMLDIGEKPMVLHIMSWYGRFGFRRFVLCTGHRSEVISAYFANFAAFNADYTVDLASRSISYHQNERHLPAWEVTVAFTGVATMTGGRLARAAGRYLGDAEHFGVTYGDGLTYADLGEELRFHAAHVRLGTVLGVHPPSPFGRLGLHEDAVVSFAEKPRRTEDTINGGFFFRRGFLDYLTPAEDCVLEREPLDRLTRDGQLGAYHHGGYWSCVDTQRDHSDARGLWESGAAPWKW